MSLRSQIHNAVDDVTPPAPSLERKVTMFVLAGERERKVLRARPRRSPWTYRFQGAAALVAAGLVVVLVAGIVVGGRYWRNLNSAPATVSSADLKSLESRPVHFPPVAAGTQCPETSVQFNEITGTAVGDGPVYLIEANTPTTTSWGYWVSLDLIYVATARGPVLIRARDLKSDRQVVFGRYPLEPSAVSPAGSVLGTDRVYEHTVQMRAEATFQDPWQTPPMDKEGHLPPLVVALGLQSGGSGCIGFQIDGPGFSENFVVNPATFAGRTFGA